MVCKVSEHQLWDKVRAGLTDAADLKIDLMRVENLVMAGPPDVNGCYKGVEFWLELKHKDAVPARDSTPIFREGVGLRPEQVVWLHRRARHGGRCWILGRAGESIWLVHGRHAKAFNDAGYLQLVELSDWWWNGKKVDWKGLLSTIVGE